MRKAVPLGILTLLLLVVASLVANRTPEELPLTTLVGSFFDADYDVSVQFLSFRKESRFVRLSDGTDLAVDIFVPEDAADDGGSLRASFPTILEYTPYSRAFAQPGMPWWQRIGLRWRLGLKEPVYDRSLFPSVRTMIGLGYAYVVVDMRGTGASFGSQTPLMPRLGSDGAQIVDWITSQPWSDGSVGMRGDSYGAWSQYATASQAPDGLQCIAPGVIMFATFTEGTRPGGITAIRWLSEYSDFLQAFNLSQNDQENGFFPAAPVIDEDGDERWLDEIPLTSAGDTTLFTDEDELTYPDGHSRDQHYLARAVTEHKNNILGRRLLEPDMRFWDATQVFGEDTLSFSDTSPGAMLDRVAESGVSVLNLGGWFDGFVRGTTKLFSSMEPGPGMRMMIGPRFHVPAGVTSAYQDLLRYDGDLASDIVLEEIRFFDWCLKGIDSGISGEEPVLLYVMNRGWRREKSWPLQRQEIYSLHLGASGSLTPNEGEPGSDRYDVDFDHSADYGSNKMNRWILMWSPDSLMVRTELDERTLVYETEPLNTDMEVTGHPVANLWVSANQPDADVFVYLSDVAPDGTVHYVTEGQLRAGFHEMADPMLQTGGQRPVRPELPWYGFRAEDYDANAFADDRILNLRFDLQPTSWVFGEGHRIRIAIAGADEGNFELHPDLCTNGDPEQCLATTLTVHRGSARQSRIELPVIPLSQLGP